MLWMQNHLIQACSRLNHPSVNIRIFLLVSFETVNSDLGCITLSIILRVLGLLDSLVNNPELDLAISARLKELDGRGKEGDRLCIG